MSYKLDNFLPQKTGFFERKKKKKKKFAEFAEFLPRVRIIYYPIEG